MDKRIYLTSVAMLLIFWASAQSLEDFNQERLDMNKKGMLVLGTWAVSNIALSPILASRTTGSSKYFHQMNGYWNGVNLVLAGFGLYNAVNADPASFTLAETIKEQHSIEKILLLNTGLDVGYIAGGLYLRERGSRRGDDRLVGFGKSIMLQGAFLFAFDLTFYLFQAAHGKHLLKFVDKLAIAPGGFSMVWKL